jgi:hypothetical protein
VLTDPVLMDATLDSVRVVWFTETPGRAHHVEMASTNAPARTSLLTRTAEDADSRVPGRTWSTLTSRPVWRHEALLSGLAAGERRPYRVISDGQSSPWFTLGPAPAAGDGRLILLTSDHQLMPMAAANLQLAAEVAGDRLGAVFVAGDLVNFADRASDWFDDAGGSAFFPTIQGRARVQLGGREWHGAALAQHVPLYPAPGNHEVTGVRGATLRDRFDLVRPGEGDTTTYEQIFGRPRWYATTVGPARLIVLFAARKWRPYTWDGSAPSTFAEATADLAHPDGWGHGQHLFESLARGSRQHTWLADELSSAATRAAPVRVVMLHHPIHSIGLTSAPAFTDPDCRSTPFGRRYEYPAARDQLLHDVEPLLSRYGVELVHNGHTHIWTRFRNPAGVNFLETSNVGNTFGAYPTGGSARRILPGPADGFAEDYPDQGDAGGLAPIEPTKAPEYQPDGSALPFFSSLTATAFSLLDMDARVVRSYRADLDRPDPEVVLFDELTLG